jgi:hypothetical protein
VRSRVQIASGPSIFQEGSIISYFALYYQVHYVVEVNNLAPARFFEDGHEANADPLFIFDILQKSIELLSASTNIWQAMLPRTTPHLHLLTQNRPSSKPYSVETMALALSTFIPGTEG